MSNEIQGFTKTKHFAFRQCERQFNDDLIRSVLRAVKVVGGKQVVIATPSFFSRELGMKMKDCLVLILQRKWLITCYPVKDLNAVIRKERDAAIFVAL